MDANLNQVNQALNSYSSQLDWSAVLGPSELITNTDRVKTYDDNAKIYDKEMHSHCYGGPQAAAEAVHKYAKSHADIKMLDVGCGTGLAVESLLKLAHYTNIDGLEPAQKMLNVGIEKGYYKKGYNQFFGLDSGIEKDCYDIIFSVGAFIPNHIKAVAVKEMCRIIKPGGFIIISTRANYLKFDRDLVLLKPIIQEMEKQGEIRIVEDREYDNHFVNQNGHLFVLQNI